MTFDNRPEDDRDSLDRDDFDRDLELLSASLDGELTPDARAALDTRLAAEPALARELERLRATRALVRLLPELRAPRNFTLSPAQARAARAAAAPPPLAPWTTFVGMAAGLLLILAGIALVTSSPNTPTAASVAGLPTPSASALPAQLFAPPPTATNAPVLDEVETEADTVAGEIGAANTVSATDARVLSASPLPSSVTEIPRDLQQAQEEAQTLAPSPAMAQAEIALGDAAAEAGLIAMTPAATLAESFTGARSGTLEATPAESDAAASAFVAPSNANAAPDGMTTSGGAGSAADAAQSAAAPIAQATQALRPTDTPKPTETDTPLPSATHTATRTPSATPTETPTLRSTPTLTESPAAAAPVNARGDETISADTELNTRLPLGFLLIGFGAALFAVAALAILRRRR